MCSVQLKKKIDTRELLKNYEANSRKAESEEPDVITTWFDLRKVRFVNTGMMNYDSEIPCIDWRTISPYRLQEGTSFKEFIKEAFPGYEHFYTKTFDDGDVILCFAKPDKQECLKRIFQWL